jgi:methionyl-tRNA formyltransferase
VKVVFAGTPVTAVPTLEALIASRHEVVAVLTRPDARVGRGRTLTASPVAQAAESRGITVLKPTSTSDADFLLALSETEADLGVIVAYGALLRRDVLDALEFGWINLHYSVLPSWRGAAPVQRSIMAGDEVTGASVFSLVEALDAGPVLGTITERITETDTAGDLLERLSVEGARLVADVVDHIEDGDIGAVTQSAEGVSYAHKLTTDDARVDWNLPSFAIDRLVRGCTPAPGAWTQFDGLRIKLGPLSPVGDSTLAPGVVSIGKHEVRVGTATTDVVLGEVQAHGKKVMAAADWGRGLSGRSEVRFI